MFRLHCFCFFLLPVLFLISCAPGPEIIIVPDNTAPPDFSVPELAKENYVNKVYITLLGRKPSDSEFSRGMALLDENNASTESREKFIDEVLVKPGFSQRMYEIARTEILNNVDTADITFQIVIFTQLLSDPVYEPFYDLIETEIGRLTRLRDVPKKLENGEIDRIEMHRRMVDNFIYDEINMGTQNFVLSMFEYFLGRYPTAKEEEVSIQMVDGFNTVVFGEEGDSKAEFIEIFFESDNYFEGQVVNIYEDFLFRSPNSVEMGEGTEIYKTTLDYSTLLKTILAKDEFLGI